MYKIDLHTHSIVSPDGGITEKAYEDSIAKKVLDYVAITDHNRIDFALSLQKKLGDKIIVGEEIQTYEGEIIGLFLQTKIQPLQSIKRTMELIHQQEGLIYIPHPFDVFRHGIGEKNMQEFLNEIDIVEGFNGRVLLPSANRKAWQFAQTNQLPIGVGSDAHGRWGIGKAYLVVDKSFTKTSAKQLLKQAQYVTKYQHWYGYFMPSVNKIKKKFVPKRKVKDEK